jgi:ABC-type antimicrobial peptide transport system permease subunit
MQNIPNRFMPKKEMPSWALLLLIAAALSQLLRQELYGISNLDPIAYLSAIGFFAAITALAALRPARRALRIDPLRALRND